MTFLPMVILVVGGLIGAVRALILRHRTSLKQYKAGVALRA